MKTTMKEKILHCAEVQLMKGGYDLLNFATIAERLEITRANIHYHFKNKETLAIEVTKKYGKEKCNAFEHMRRTYKGDFFKFAELVDQSLWMEMDDEDDGGVGFFALISLDPKVPKSLLELTQKIYNDVDNILIDALNDAIESGEIRKDIDVKREAMRGHVLMIGMSTCGESFLNYGQSKEELKGLILDWAHSLK